MKSEIVTCEDKVVTFLPFTPEAPKMGFKLVIIWGSSAASVGIFGLFL
jgi:hypothetical protein